MRAENITRVVIFIIGMTIIAGCTSTQATNYYTLSSAREGLISTDTYGTDSSLIIGLMPVEIPDYIDRPQLVTRKADGQVLRSDFNKWAGSIRTDIERVIVENISDLTGSNQVLRFPWSKSVPIQYQISVRIERLDGAPGRDIDLSAYWMILDRYAKNVLHMQETRIVEPVHGSTYKDFVRSQSRALLSLSMAISNVLKEITRERQ